MQNFEVFEETNLQNTVIKVIGVGGGGGNAVQYMIDKGASGVEFIVANTDEQALKRSSAHLMIQLGETGLGAGAKPEVGAEYALQKREEIKHAIQGSNLLFITAGMGGGTGTGAAPVVAQVAKELGILTVGVVTKPFSWEGKRRMATAEKGVEELRKYADCMLVILNQKLEKMATESTTMQESFAMSNEVLYKACIGIADIIHMSGLINVDFSDVETIMTEHGSAIIGSATASGEDRAVKAAERAINCPLLEGTDLSGARGMLLNFCASSDLMMAEMNKAMALLSTFTHEDCNIIWGTSIDDTMGDELRITVIATGLDNVRPSMVHVPTPASTPLSPIAARPTTSVVPVAPMPEVTPLEPIPSVTPLDPVAPMDVLPETKPEPVVTSAPQVAPTMAPMASPIPMPEPIPEEPKPAVVAAPEVKPTVTSTSATPASTPSSKTEEAPKSRIYVPSFMR